MKKPFLRRLGAVLLSGALLLSAGAVLPAGEESPFSLTASALTTADGKFEYTVSDNHVTVTKWTGTGEDAVIPSKIDGKPVTAIGDSAFSGQKTLQSVIIPGTVTRIGEKAFYQCYSLKTLALPGSVEAIGSYAFCYCTHLTSVAIPKKMTVIEERTFAYCSGLESITIPEGVTSIGEWAFAGCKALTSLTIPGSVSEVPSYACYNCFELKTVQIGFGPEKIGGNAFQNCGELTDVTIPNSVTMIGESAFENCPSLPGITIPDSVTKTGMCVFRNCTALTSLTISNNLTSLRYRMFENCTSLKTVKIPDGMKLVDTYAFKDCTSLVSVVIPDKNTELDYESFVGCEKLTIYGIPGSLAQEYAEKNQVPFAAASLQNTSTLSKTTVPKLNGVTVKGRSVQGKGTVTYAFYYKKMDSKGWTSVGTKYDGTTEATIFPNSPAVYQIMVKAKDKTGRISSKIMTLAVTVPTKDDLVNRSYSPNTTVKKGAAVSVNGKASGGAGRYTYAYYYRKASGKAFTSIGTPFVNQTKAWFRPASAGEYVVRVLAKDIEGTVALKEYKVTVTK